MSNTSILGDFVIRRGDQLLYGPGEKDGLANLPFRFISFNSSEAIMNCYSATGLPDEFELRDLVESVRQMGGTVLRVFCITAGPAGKGPHMVTGLGRYNEDAFRVLDKLLEICNEKDVRLIIPLVDNYDFVGFAPIDFYSSWRGKSRLEFYTDPDVISDFKSTVTDIINRENHYTHIKYKDDKAILAWETGNELQSAPYHSWTHEIAQHIKTQDANHLFLDGNFGIDPLSLDDPYIDIVSNHFYPWTAGTDYAGVCYKDRQDSKSKKVYIVGEFGYLDDPGPDYPDSMPKYSGMKGTESMKVLLDEVISNGTSGAMIWAYRFRSRNGGFYNHVPGYETYRWPGFPEGERWKEAERMALMRQKAYVIRNVPEPAIVVPEPPVLLPVVEAANINWKGSAGASSYDIQRSERPEGPWEIVGNSLSDGRLERVGPSKPLFTDTTAVPGQKYYYRVIAKNAAGESLPSNIERLL